MSSSIKELSLAFFKGLAFGKGLIMGRELAENKDMAEDTKEDGFATLTDKNGNTYVAQMNESEKTRYKETGKPLSKVKKDRKDEEIDFWKNEDITGVSENQKSYALTVKQTTLKKLKEYLEKKGIELTTEQKKTLKDFSQITSASFWLNNRNKLGYGSRKLLKPEDLDALVKESKKPEYIMPTEKELEEKRKAEENRRKEIEQGIREERERIAQERRDYLAGTNIPKGQKILKHPMTIIRTNESNTYIMNPMYPLAVEKLGYREAKYLKEIRVDTSDITIKDNKVQAMNDSAYQELLDKNVKRDFIE